MDGMTAIWAFMGIAACGLLVLGLLAALLLVHGQFVGWTSYLSANLQFGVNYHSRTGS